MTTITERQLFDIEQALAHLPIGAKMRDPLAFALEARGREAIPTILRCLEEMDSQVGEGILANLMGWGWDFRSTEHREDVIQKRGALFRLLLDRRHGEGTREVWLLWGALHGYNQAPKVSSIPWHELQRCADELAQDTLTNS